MRKKILFVIWSYSYGGGAEKVLTNLVNNLSPEKYEIDILEYFHIGIKIEPTRKDVKILKPIINDLKDHHLKKRIIEKLVYKYPKLLRKLFNNKKYDVEIAFNYQIPSFLLDYSANTCTICWTHGDVYDLKEKAFYRMLQNKSYNFTSTIVAISNFTKKSVIELFPDVADKVVKIENGFNFEDIIEQSTVESSYKFNKQTICFVGRLESGKNPIQLLEVLKIVLDLGLDIDLAYIGQGDLEAELKKKTKDLDLNNNVKFLGFHSNPLPLIKQCKLLIMMSKAEGFPTVFVEGLTLGVPFISTNVGGVEELSNNGKCGKIIDSVSECAYAIIEILKNKKLYHQMSENGKIHIKNYSVNNQIKKFEELIKTKCREEK